MKSKRWAAVRRFPLCVVALVLVAVATTAFAQSPSDPDKAVSIAPPFGQYAPPPLGAEAQGMTYDDRAQRYDRDYADQYSRWAAQYCVDRRDNRTAAGAAIGGVLGAVLGSGIAGRGGHVGGAVVGGVLGATAGAAIGANTDTACPPGYVVLAGAPAFHYYGPVFYAPQVTYGPAWYKPWVWVDGRWVYRPYRYWYWHHRAHWRPDWRPRRWTYRYRRW